MNQTTIEGYQQQPGEDVKAQMSHVGPGYFRAMGTRVRQGREFTPRDSASAAPVAVINEAMARKYWAGRSALGGRFEHHGSWITVVGVVENSVDRDIREPAGPFAYLAFDQWLAGKASIATDPAHLFVRGRASAADLVPLVRGELRGLDPELPVHDVVPFEERAGALLMTQRMGLVLLGFFSTLALALSAVGMYGVASYVAASRTREIGIRMALGSSRREIGRLMLRQSARPLAAGLLAGLALALAAGRLAGAFLYGVDPYDPLTLGGVALLLAVVALLAAYVPARRASRVDPVTALRVE